MFQGRGLRLVSQKATLLLTTLYNTLLGVDTLHDMPLYEADTPSQHPLAHVDMVINGLRLTFFSQKIVFLYPTYLMDPSHSLGVSFKH